MELFKGLFPKKVARRSRDDIGGGQLSINPQPEKYYSQLEAVELVDNCGSGGGVIFVAIEVF